MSFLYVYPDLFSTEDTGLVSGSSPENEDLGIVTLTADSRENLGSITIFTDIPDPYQLPEAYGSIADSVDLTDDYGLITESALGNYISYGELLENILRVDNLTSSGKSRTYRYTISSIGSFSVEDLGLLGDTVVYEEYGSITDPNAEYDNNGYLADNTSDLNPFGTLSAFGGAAESRVYSYNDSTTLSDFYGSIIESVDSIIDYGLTSESLNESSVTTDYGGILDPLTPSPNTLGNTGLSTISGDATYKEINSEVASGTLSAFGGAAESRAYSYSDSYNDSSTGSDAYGLLTQDVDSVEDYGLITSFADQISDYGGFEDGSLVISGNKVEKATYFYNQSSIYTFGGYEDLGQLSDSVVYEDNGDLTYDYYRSFYDNYGYIVDGETTITPYGTIVVGGAAITVKQGENIDVGSGTIDISGDATYKEINSEVGFGTLSAFGGAAESRAYSYNDSSTGSVSYEFITDSIDSVDDYGLITSSVDQISDYAGFEDGFTPYGTLQVSGDSTHKEIYNEVASGTIGALSGAAEVYGPNPPENTVLFTISGDATYSDINSEVASGTLSAFGGAAESRAYSYNDSASGSESYEFIIDSIDSVEDYGLITSSVDQISDYGGLLGGATTPYGTLSINGQKVEKATYSYNESSVYVFGGYEDLGQLSDSVVYEDNGDLTYDYYRSFYDNYGYIVDGESNVSPYGTITVSGDAITARQGDNIGTGSGLVEIAGDATYKEINSEVGSGTLSAFGGAAESRVYSYNESSISESVSYGSIDDAVVYIDDHGSITESVNPISDYGYILDDSVTPYGTVVLSGDSTHKEIYSEVASGTIGALSGAAEVYGPNPPENTVLFTFSGDATYSDINSEVASGTLSAFGGAAESRVYSYNDSSTGSESYGLVSEFIDSVDDYGLITASVDQIADYGGLLDGIAPYGTLNLSGQKIEKVTYSYNESSIYTFGGYEDLGQLGDSVVYEDYGNLEFTLFFDQYGYVADAETNVSPFGTITFSGEAVTVKQGENIDVGSGTIDISGNATYKEINSEVASGTLSAFGGAAESRAYSYNDSSISQPVDYGSVIESLDSIDDYGFIIDSADQIFDYAGFEDGFTPYGTVVLSGDATYKEIYNEVASGTIGALSGAAEVYGPNPPENTVLFTISGDATYKETNSEVGTGSISAINGAAESRVYSYNDSSTGSESYGTVVETTDSFDDYGLIISSVDQIADYGGLLDGTTPYGTIQVSGQKVEKVTYSYNESSIYTFGGYEDLGQLSDSVVYEDYGNLEFTLFYDQYGYVVDAETTVNPFGTITFSGEAVTVKLGENIGTGTGTIEISGSLTESFTPATEIGSGTLSAFGGAAESRAYSYNDSSTGSESYGTILESIDSIDDYGLITSSVDQISDYGGLLDGVAPYGTLQISGQKVERATYSYNESSIYTFGGYEDLGQLSDTVTYEDNGDLTYDYNNSFYDNYGYIVDGESTVTPFGTITVSGDAKTIPVIPSATSGTIEISGSLTESFTPATEIGSGTIGVLSGAAEAYGPNPPENTVLFTISGDAVDRQTDFWTASGTIDISGSAIGIYQPSVSTSGTIDISGDATYSDINREVGSGQFSALSGAAEVYGPNPPENTVLFAISGDATYKEINSEVGSGTIVISGDAKIIPVIPSATSGTIDISGDATYSDINREVASGTLSAFGGGAEAYGPNPPENTVLFTISGDATYSDINSEVGTGTIRVSGDAKIIPVIPSATSGTIDISGDATYSDINSEVGSGTLSTLSGAAESYGPNPPENTVLFGITGNVVDRQTDFWTAAGTIDISGSLAESFTPATEIGSGTIGALSGAAEVYGSNPPENTVLFTIFGDAVDRQTDFWTASGTIDISGTHKQNVQVYVPTITGNCEIEIGSRAIYQFQSKPIISGGGLIEISGSLNESITPATEIGSGTIGALSGAAEVYGSNPPENTVLFTISGDANTRYFNVYTGPASGTIEISGGISTDRQIYVPNFVGSGTIEVSGDAGAHRERPYISSGIISISGIGEESFGRGLYTGSGSFSIFGGHAEEFGANPPEDAVIGTISGSAVPKKVFSHTATGIATISGNGAWNFARSNYQGSGTLRTLSGSAEVYGPNPPENTVLFSITGDARQKVRFSESGIGTVSISGSSVEKYGTSNVGIGTLNVSGAATSIAKISRFIGSGLIEISGERGQKRTFTYNASGTLSAIRGSAEAFGANPPENNVILTIGGDANTRYFNVYTGPASGTIEVSGGITTERQIYVPKFTGSGVIRVSGDAGTPRTRPYDGSGTIRILGSANESYIRTTYNGSGEINVSGIGSYEYREYEPPFTYVTII